MYIKSVDCYSGLDFKGQNDDGGFMGVGNEMGESFRVESRCLTWFWDNLYNTFGVWSWNI